MAQLGQAFDASSVEPNAPAEIIPPGKYPVQIVNSEMRATKDGNGQYLWLELDLIDGPHRGRKLWDRLNLVNANQQAQDIAQRTLSAICHATGQMHVSDSEQLHMRPMLATVKVRPAGPDRSGTIRDAQNEVRGYEAMAGGHAPQAAAPTPRSPAPRPMATAASVPPWQRSQRTA